MAFHVLVVVTSPFSAQGDLPNANSGGDPAGHNTDGFDCSTTNLIIENSSVKNQVGLDITNDVLYLILVLG